MQSSYICDISLEHILFKSQAGFTGCTTHISQKVLTKFIGVVTARYQQRYVVLITECHQIHKYIQSLLAKHAGSVYEGKPPLL